MRSKLMLTDKLMIALLAVSVLTALLHGTLPAAICAGVHILVTVCVSALHLLGRKPQAVRAVLVEEEINR